MWHLEILFTLETMSKIGKEVTLGKKGQLGKLTMLEKMRYTCKYESQLDKRVTRRKSASL